MATTPSRASGCWFIPSRTARCSATCRPCELFSSSRRHETQRSAATASSIGCCWCTWREGCMEKNSPSSRPQTPSTGCSPSFLRCMARDDLRFGRSAAGSASTSSEKEVQSPLKASSPSPIASGTAITWTPLFWWSRVSMRTSEALVGCSCVVATSTHQMDESPLHWDCQSVKKKTKTGTHQWVIVGSVALGSDLLQLASQGHPHDTLLPFSMQTFKVLWNDAKSQLKLTDLIGPPHSLRHAGASYDIASDFRSLEMVRRSGRWQSRSSVQRCAKTWILIRARAKLPRSVLDIGADAFKKRGKTECSELPTHPPECMPGNPATLK